MASKYEEPSDTIARLRQELKDRNNDIHRAATVGKELLEKTERLAKEGDVLLSENESLKQEKYSLQLDLETQVQTVNTQSSEIELLRDQYDTVVKQLEILRKENVTLKQQINGFKRERTDFEKTQEDVQRENQSLKRKINSLELQIKELQLKTETSLNLGVTVSEQDKETDVNFYVCQNKKLSEAVSELQCELESSKLTEKQLANKVTELEEEVCERDKELRGFSVEIQKAKDYATDLQGEIEVLKLEQIDVNRRGNSVFGEIDDRRKIIEKEYKLLMKRYESLSSKFKTVKKELISCKGQMAILFTMTSHTHQDSYIDKLEDQLGSARREIGNLTEKLKTVMRERQHSKQEQVSSGSGEYDYLRVMNEQAEKKIKDMENELIRVHQQKMADNDELVQTRREMYEVQLELDEANLEIMKLHHKIKELTLTLETEAPTVNETEIVVREFDPNKITDSKNGRKNNRHKKKMNENEKSPIKVTVSQTVIEDKDDNPDLSCRPPFKPVLQNFNDIATKHEAYQIAESNLREKSKISDNITQLYSTSYMDSYKTSSKDRKQGQCAQQ